IRYHHFGGGIHFFLRDYDRKLKLYTGLGGFCGFNQYELQYTNNEAINGSGLDFGVYGIMGMRWCCGHVKVGFEYRAGYANMTLFDDQKGGDMHEFSFCIG